MYLRLSGSRKDWLRWKRAPLPRWPRASLQMLPRAIEPGQWPAAQSIGASRSLRTLRPRAGPRRRREAPSAPAAPRVPRVVHRPVRQAALPGLDWLRRGGPWAALFAAAQNQAARGNPRQRPPQRAGRRRSRSRSPTYAARPRMLTLPTAGRAVRLPAVRTAFWAPGPSRY